MDLEKDLPAYAGRSLDVVGGVSLEGQSWHMRYGENEVHKEHPRDEAEIGLAILLCDRSYVCHTCDWDGIPVSFRCQALWG